MQSSPKNESYKPLKKNNLRQFAENPSPVALGCGVAMVFLSCIAVGGILKMMTTSAGKSLIFLGAIWIPILILAYYSLRVIRSFGRMPRGGDSALIDRLQKKIEVSDLKTREPPAPLTGLAADNLEDADTTSADPEAPSEQEPPSFPG